MQLQSLQQWLNAIWYGSKPVPWYLTALETLMIAALRTRRRLYAAGVWRSQRVTAPVIVVGNLTVGGTGKTPLVNYLVTELRQRGWTPGVVLRGYGGNRAGPELVATTSSPRDVGDEAVMIARATGAAVAIGRKRPLAASLLIERAGCDVVVADDGLQHWPLARDIEIVVVDGARRFGNGRLLPAGPLREPQERLSRVDFVVANGSAQAGEVSMRVTGSRAVSLVRTGHSIPLEHWRDQRVHAVAGIGNPERFFEMLQGYGIRVERHPLPDHHDYVASDLRFDDQLPVLITEKDAVKCATLAHERIYVVPVEAQLPATFIDAIQVALHRVRSNAS